MRKAAFICAVSLLLGSSIAHAIVAPSNTPGDFTGEWTGTNYDWSMSAVPVYNFNNLSCEMIAPNAVIMANHCSPTVGGGIIANGEIFRFTQILQPPDGADLALCILDHASTNYVLPYGGPATSGTHVIMIGYGMTGITYPDCFVPNSLNHDKHWGTNAIDYAGSWLTMNYHAGDTEFESGLGVGDSGGGTYVNTPNGWRQAGVNVAIGSGGSQPGGYIASYAVSIPNYYEWIVQNVTLPGDYDFNGKVDFDDYLNLECYFGRTTVNGVESSDYNDDGKVDFADYLVLESNFGKSSTWLQQHSFPAPVPEPTTLGLLALGLAGWVVRRGKR